MKLLFVCTGNICRSPLAEGIAPLIAKQFHLVVEAKSAGTLGLSNIAADPHSVAVCKEVGVDISKHLSQGLSEELINWADYILVMERRHAEKVRGQFPQSLDKVLELGSFGSMSAIPDPIGGWKFKFRRTRKQITKCLEGFFKNFR